MEKNKNRTDLLAAGRKKLQQFRQKKDGKGNSSKPPGKGGKSGRDVTAGTVAEAAVAQKNVPDGEISKYETNAHDATMGTSTDELIAPQHDADRDRLKLDAEDTAALPGSDSMVDTVASDAASSKSGHGTTTTTVSTGESALTQGGEKYNDDADDTIGLSDSSSRVDSVTSYSDAAIDEHSAKADVRITYLSEAAEYPSERSGADCTKLNQSDVGGHDVSSRVDWEDGSSSLVLDDTTNNVREIVFEDRSEDSSLSLHADVSSGLEREHGEVQVTDVGPVQEFGSSSGYHIDGGMVNLLDGDGNHPSTGTRESTGDNTAVDSGNTLAEEKIHGATQLSKTDDFPSTVSIINYAGEGQDRGEISFDSNEEKANVVNASGGNVGFHIEGTWASSGFVEVERSSEVESNDDAKSLMSKQIDLSSILDGSVVKLSQLAEILQVLDEDDFRCLIMSRESSLVSSRNEDKMKANDHILHDAFERLKEHLYVTSLSKDAIHLQLSEHQKWVDEVCAVNSSLVEVQEKNDTLSREITQCRDEIEKVVSERVELKQQLQSSKADGEVFAAKVNELQNKLDMTQGEMSSIFTELVECRHQVNALQSENENLNESLKAMTEEKSKIWEEREIFLLENEKVTEELNQYKVSLESLQKLLQDDRKQFEVENYGMNSENSRLCADLTEYKNAVEALMVENKNLNDTLSSLSEERRKLEEEKTLVDHQIEKISKEMIDCKGLTATLQTEIISLNTDITSIEDEKNNLVEEMNIIFSEYEKQTCELVEFKVLDAVLQAECSNAFNDLKEARIHIMHLTEENESLNADAGSAGIDRSKHDSLKEHNDQVHKANIELMVLYEVMRELIHQAVVQESELLGLRDALQKQEAVLKSENTHLREKMNSFEAKINELQGHSVGFCRDSDEMVASISNQLEALQAEVAGRESILEQEWNSVSAQILQTVGILDSNTKNISANSLPCGNSSRDVVSSVAASVEGACKVIEDLHRQLDDAQRDCQEMSHKTDVALIILHRLYCELSQLVKTSFGYCPDEAENIVADDKRLDLLRPDFFNVLLDQLKKLWSERLEFESVNKQLSPVLSNTARETDKLPKLCLESDTVLKLIDEIEQSVQLEGVAIYADEPASLLESLIHLLVEKYREASQGVNLCAPLEMQVHDLQCQVEHLNFVLLEYGNENLIFKHSLKSAQEVLIAINSRLQEKVTELEQSELRVSSLREKLSIAVTKGKGLISQRESLKQSLSETSKELEKCSQELLSKDARLHELEAKVKVYSEAGERMEALESELSYIRNSATALRESFLLKDSVLQRLEEILEDLELPEHFHSRDIIEKIDWLAKLVGSHSLTLGEWDQRSSAGGGSYSDAGFVGQDGLKEDMLPNTTINEDLRRRYEELENRFYGLAEQNEMLEQSLMERNNLVQQWEEILNRIDMPSQLRSMEPEDKIQWLGSALSEAQNHSYSLQEKIDNLETLRGSLTADLEDSHRRTFELEAAFQKACSEKEILLKDLEILRQDNDVNVKRIDDFALRNENLQNEASIIQAQKLRLEEDMGRIGDAIRRLQGMVNDALQDSCPEDVVLGQEGVGFFEEMLKKLVEKHKTLLSERPADVDSTDVPATEKELSHASRDFEEQDAVIATLSKDLEVAMGELMSLKEEKDRYMLTNQSLIHELEEQKSKNKELEDLFNQEEHKSASLREKLNVAVRKGKSLVQQRDGMKQMIGELNTEVERLKSEGKHNEKTINEYEEQIKNLSAFRDRVQVMESENSLLRGRVAETERYLQEKEGSWSSILNALGEIDVGHGIDSGDPLERIRDIGNYLHDLHSQLASLEQETRKSKRAAELLLAELNEVQERNDVLQEELAKAVHEISEVSKEKSLAENAKYEALAHVEKLSYLHSEEKDRHMSEIMALKSGVDKMTNDLNAIERELGDVLSKDLEVLNNVKVMMTSFLDLDFTPALGALFPGSFTGGIMSTKLENRDYMTQIDSIRERIHKHSYLFQEETSRLSEAVVNVRREYTTQKEFYESVKNDFQRLQSTEKERESELHVLQGNIELLYDTCARAISILENWKEHEAGNVMTSRPSQRNLKSLNQNLGNSLTGDLHTFNEESIRSMCDKLLLVVGDSINMQTTELARVVEVSQSEMKSTIMNLQKELQEKDIQRERVCKELVNQIKEAETDAKNYLLDLQQATVKLHDSQRQLDVMVEEHKLLEQRMKELHDKEMNSTHLQQKIDSLTDALAAKVQECEALMQALDEQEAEMENLTNKIVGLENELQQKSKDSESLEASRAKVLKKLSVTVSKFDELHCLSENLLSEVEKLQSQLQEKDGEISFLRQEVTRCTNDALAVTQMSKKRSSDEIQELLSWLDSLVSRVQVHDVASDSKTHLVSEYKDVLQKKILDLISELENLREMTQNSDKLLQEERIKVEEMAQKEQLLKNSLREMESQLVVLQGVGDSANATKSNSEIVEVEPMTKKWASAGPIAPQVRSLRKPNNDQVAIAIDMDNSSQRLEDDDDKAHGFKSLTTSKIVPRFTRPVSDMVDGLWVSCDRALMRQPALRLGVIIYWAVLHAMLATFVV